MAAAGPDPIALLADLLQTLRHRGLAIGPREIDRLRIVFEREPRLGRRQLKALLRLILVRSASERELFDSIFDIWCDDGDARWPAPEPLAAREAAQPDPPSSASTQAPHAVEHAPPWWRTRRAALAAALVALLLAVVAMMPPPELATEHTLDPAPTAVAPPPQPDELPSEPAPEVWYWHAHIDRITPRELASPALLAGLGIAALALAVGLLLRHRHRFPALRPVPRERPGPGWQPLPEQAAGAVVPRAERQRALWQVERIQSEDPTPRLDLPRTVDDTARAGGFVRAHYLPACYERSVQFWWDRQLDAPTARAAAGELAATLRAGGIECHECFFYDLPDHMDGTLGKAFRPIHEEGAGREAVVAVFLDGEGLAEQLRHPLRRHGAERLLRDLGHWPKLCFVDCSPGGNRVARLFRERRLRLQTIRPEMLPQWLAGDANLASGARRPARGAPDDWKLAAALALGGLPVRREVAIRLDEALGLGVDIWRIEAVVAESARDPAGVAERINRLLHCEPLSGDDLPRAGSLAFRAAAWWRKRYQTADEDELAAENRLQLWRDSPSRLAWQIEAALLGLYVDPCAAVDRLFELASGDRKAAGEISARLAALCAEDDPRPPDDTRHLVHLTWKFAGLPIETCHKLLALGFQVASARALTPLPPPLALGAGMLGGVAAACLGLAAWFLFAPPLPQLHHEAPHEDPTLAAQTLRISEPTALGGHRIHVGSARAPLAAVPAAAASEVEVSWTWDSEPNLRRLGNSELMRAGRLAQPIRGCSRPGQSPAWPQRSLVAIDAEPGDQGARQLAIRLLDLGSADQVLIGRDWPEQFEAWLGDSAALRAATQLLVLGPPGDAAGATTRLGSRLPPAWAAYAVPDFSALARALVDNKALRGVQPVDGAAAGRLPWRRVGGSGEVLLYGGPAVTADRYGIEWAEICPGTFTRGVLPVALSAFEITVTEITQAQFAPFTEDKKGDATGDQGRLPAVDVTWQQAREACRKAGGDLPTEAQWEYAARGGSRGGWSFGDDPSALGEYAWYAENSGLKLHEVGTRRPNPLGLSDMHGNAWEWTRDGYEDYPPATEPTRLLLDPWVSGESARRRVVRGGSFVDPPVSLRSADRVVFVPVVRRAFLGFRCVRVPPQP